MQNKKVDFGKRSGLQVRPVSLGSMRLVNVEQEQAVKLIRQAVNAGMVYIDTSRGYGDAEIKVGKSLKDGYRDKVILSTKWAPWIKKYSPDDDTSADCTYKRIIESLERLDVEYVDFYQIWGVSNYEKYRSAVRKGGMLDGILRAMNDGLVKHTGFTTHDKPENVSKYIDEADWAETILFTYNMLNQAYKEVLAKAHEKGIATAVMNPVGGGMFAESSPVLKKAVKQAVGLDNPAEAAYRYLLGDKNVDTILCGIAKETDITSTITYAAMPAFTEEQRKDVEKVMAGLSQKSLGFCTSCGYCLPCPQGINIPEMLNIFYLDRMLECPKKAEEVYELRVTEGNLFYSEAPSVCTECGKCEQQCTQNLKIIDKLKYITERFEEKQEKK